MLIRTLTIINQAPGSICILEIPLVLEPVTLGQRNGRALTGPSSSSGQNSLYQPSDRDGDRLRKWQWKNSWTSSQLPRMIQVVDKGLCRRSIQNTSCSVTTSIVSIQGLPASITAPPPHQSTPTNTLKINSHERNNVFAFTTSHRSISTS